jgi:NAD(P) transhydrogenase
MGSRTFDLVVIGSGPAGQKGAICAAKMGKRVAVVERRGAVGGVCVHTGTIPSKTLREAVLYLTGTRERAFYGRGYTLKEDISLSDLSSRVRLVVEREIQVIRAQLRRNRVTLVEGTARFAGPHEVEVEREGAEDKEVLHAEHVLIACGTRPARAESVPVDGRYVLDPDQLPELPDLPREMIVVGAGVIGTEYAALLATLGIHVTLVDQRPIFLDFIDRQILEALSYHMRARGVIFRLGEKVVSVDVDKERGRVVARMESGKTIRGDVLLHAVGRQPNTDLLRLEAAGLAPGPRGKLAVNEFFQTAVPHVYAAGDVIGFPALASTSMEQGRLACSHMFGVPARSAPELIPIGIYTVPEISMVGRTEEQLTAARIPYEVGTAPYAELAKGQMLGDEDGLLKLVFDPRSLKLLGVHCIGERATEIIHIGQAVLSLGATIEYFRDTVFNYPTMAEAYKVAALAGLNRL